MALPKWSRICLIAKLKPLILANFDIGAPVPRIFCIFFLQFLTKNQMSRVSSKTGSYGDDGGSLVSAALLILKMMFNVGYHAAARS